MGHRGSRGSSRRGAGAASRGRGRATPARTPRPRHERQGPRRPRPAASTSSIAEEVRSAARPADREEAGAAFERAVDLLQRGKAAQAVEAGLLAKKLAPRSGSVREVLGIALYHAERFREALRELQAYRRMTGRLDQNHLIADSYRALGAPEKAVEAAREAVRARLPDEIRAEAAIVGASALADIGRFPEALSLLRSSPSSDRLARDFDLRVWYVTGDVLERAGRRAGAAEEFRRIVRHDPGAFDAAERLARLTRD